MSFDGAATFGTTTTIKNVILGRTRTVYNTKPRELLLKGKAQ
jgi:hypothetical protein